MWNLDGTYVDREFPPNPSSLYNKTRSMLHKNELKIWKTFTWKRPCEFMPGEPQLFVGDIDPSDIVEGYLGNSYFISAIKALAENTSCIRRLFDIKKTAKEGQYFVNLSLNGENYKIEIDDFIPFYEKGKKPAFSFSKKNELWVMLVEKAWAKVCGNYESSITGMCCESFRALTGAPVEYVDHSYIQTLWKNVSEGIKNRYTICGLVEKENLAKSNMNSEELFSAYAYWVLKTYEYENEEGIVKLINIRRPQNQKWLDKFVNDSNMHKQELSKKCEIKPGDDSSLILSIEDYLCYFSTTLICKNGPEKSASSLRCKQAFGESTLLRINVSKSEIASFTVSQFNQKYVGRNEKEGGSFMRFILAREKDDDEADVESFPLNYIDGKSGFTQYANVTCDVKPGTYLAYIEILNSRKTSSNFVFRSYSEDVPFIEIVKSKDTKSFLQNALKAHAREHGERKTYEEKGEPNIFRSLSIDESTTKFGYLYYENNSKESTLKEEVAFEKLQGVEILGYEGNTSLHVEVLPGEHWIFVLNQTEKQFIMKCQYYTSIHQSMESLMDIVKIKGEQKQIKFDGKEHDIFYYVYDDGDGYVWMFENNSDDIIFEGTFYYVLNNLRIVDKAAQGGSEWKVKLNPKERSYMRMDWVDITQTWGYKWKCSFHCSDDITSEDKIIEKVIQKGEKQQAQSKGKLIDVYYYICFINDKYMWYFENMTDKKCKATFRFWMENLRFEEDLEGKPRSQWDLLLEPGAKCLKTMVQIDPYKNSKYDCSYACNLL